MKKMKLKENECFELTMTEMSNAKTIAGFLLIEGYSVQITPVNCNTKTNHGITRKYLVTIRQGLNKTEADCDTGVNDDD